MVYSLLNNLGMVLKRHDFGQAIELPIIHLGNNCGNCVSDSRVGQSKREYIELRRSLAEGGLEYLRAGSRCVYSDEHRGEGIPRRPVRSTPLRQDSRVRSL